MPVYENETYEQGVFRISYPDVAAYMEAGGGMTASDRIVWRDARRLEGLGCVDMRAMLRSQADTHPDDPAQAWDCFYIPNGRYVVETETDSYDFSIHLVQNGTLEGKRVVRYKFDGSPNYKAFAYLTRSGQLSVWRRFADDAREDAMYIRVARMMLDAVRNAGRNEVNHHARTGRGLAYRATPLSETLGIHIELRCFHCSRPISGDTNLRNFHCADHMPPERESAYDREERLREERERTELRRLEREVVGPDGVRRPRRIAPGRGARVQFLDDSEDASPVVPSVGGRTAPLPMCQVTLTEVQ